MPTLDEIVSRLETVERLLLTCLQNQDGFMDRTTVKQAMLLLESGIDELRSQIENIQTRLAILEEHLT